MSRCGRTLGEMARAASNFRIVMDGGPQDPWGTDGTSFPPRLARPSHAPQPELRHSQKANRSQNRERRRRQKGRTKRPTDGWNGRKVVMTTAASGAKQLENEDDAAPPTIAKEGKGIFSLPSPKPERYKVVRFLWLSRRLNYSGMLRPLRLLFLLTNSASV